MGKFKLGDRVKNTKEFENYGTVVNKGEVGTVIAETGSSIGVEFDKHINGHACGGVTTEMLRPGKHGHCKWFSKDDDLFEKVDKSNECIVIFRKDKEVIALDKSTGKKAVAKCSPEDTFDFKVGAKLAFERLMATSIKIVKQDKYKVGDKVKIVDKFTPDCCHNQDGLMDKYLGTVMTIEDYLMSGSYFMVEDNGRWVWNHHCIEGKVVEESEPNKVEEPVEPFPNGTIVKINEDVGYELPKGVLGKVVFKDTDGSYLIDFGVPYKCCHNGGCGRLPERTGLYLFAHNFEKVN